MYLPSEMREKGEKKQEKMSKQKEQCLASLLHSPAFHVFSYLWLEPFQRESLQSMLLLHEFIPSQQHGVMQWLQIQAWELDRCEL